MANAVPRVASGDFDVGYGDLNALIEHAGNDPDTAPVAIFVVHNASPYTIGGRSRRSDPIAARARRPEAAQPSQ